MSASPVRVALVTGGARRIGRALAMALAQDGFRVAIHSHASSAPAKALQQEIAAAGLPPAQLFSADLRDAAQAESLPRQVVERMGRINVLINSAAVMLKQPFGSVTPAQWDDVLNLNLR